MEEEGTVVYFQTSPSAQDVQEGGEDVDELTFDDKHLPYQKPNTEETPSKTLYQKLSRRIRRHTAEILKQFMCYDSEKKHLLSLVSQIKSSPLLTEEDSQVLHFSLIQRVAHSPDISSESTQTNWLSYSVTLSVLAALLAISICVSGGAPVAMTVAIGTMWSIRVLLNKGQQWKMTRASQGWLDYSDKCERMLSLLTQALRTIQETEIISRGYSRPSMSVPVSRIEMSSNTNFQCTALRKRVFNVCQSCILLLRRVTKSLCVNYSLVDELDSPTSYLTFRDLESLHRSMSEEGERDSGLGQEDDERLSLESLKDACNLLAVQNSEFLRRLALLLGLKHSENKTPKVDILEKSLTEPLKFVAKGCRDLEWSLQYQKNSLFGEPPVRTVAKSSVSSEQTYHPQLQSFAEEIHCLDLKVQLALQSVRALGLHLTQQHSSGSSPSVQDMLKLRQQLLTVQSNIEKTSEHISEGMETLNTIILPPPAEPVDTQEDVPPPVHTDTAIEPSEHKEETSDDEDLIFEAYVSLQDSSQEEERSEFTEEERERTREAHEVPVHLLRELNSVLAVRNETRERRREAKKTKKLIIKQSNLQTSSGELSSGSAPSPVTRVHMGDTTTRQTEDVSSLYEKDVSLTKPATVLTAGDINSFDGEHKAKDEQSTTERDEHSTSLSGGLAQRQLALAVAAAAQRLKRVNNEEVFYDEIED